jgi:hypothetical protein
MRKLLCTSLLLAGSLAAAEAAFIRPTASDIPVSLLTSTTLTGTRSNGWIPISRTWKLSVATLAAANTADILTSVSLQNRGIGHETNDLLCDDRGRLSTGKIIAIKGGIAAAAALIEVAVIRKWPKTARFLAVLNFAQAGVAGGSAMNNWRVSR